VITQAGSLATVESVRRGLDLLVQVLAGLLLQGFSVTLFGVTFAGAAPVSAAGIAAGFLIEGVGFASEAAALGLLYATCVVPSQ
jgi:hypothetical protein